MRTFHRSALSRVCGRLGLPLLAALCLAGPAAASSANVTNSFAFIVVNYSPKSFFVLK